MSYSVHPRVWIFTKGYGFLSYAKNMSKNIAKNIRKNLSGKDSLKHLDHAKQYATDALKATSKRVIQKTAEATMIWLVIKLLVELREFQKIHYKIIQR